MPLVGVYGGTFNPIHVGHLRAAEEVAETLGLARVLFVPSAVPPHKAGERGDAIAPGPLRLDWVRRAIADNPRFAVDPIEVERGGASYLVDTLRALRERLGAAGDEPVFLIGSDAFAEMGSWRAPRTLIELAHYAVMPRPPLRTGRLGDWLPAELRDLLELAPDGRSARHRTAGTWLRIVEIAGFDVSASALRQRLREGRSVRYLLPEAIRTAVEASGIYRAEPASRAQAAGSEDAGSDAAADERGPTGRDRSDRSGRSGRSRRIPGSARQPMTPARTEQAPDKTRLVVEAALDVKAEDVVALDVRELSSFADVFVVCTGRSDRQVRAIADSVEKAVKAAGEPPMGIEGYAEGRWVLIDLDDVIVHVFTPETRAHYDLERLWSDAPHIDVAAPANKVAP